MKIKDNVSFGAIEEQFPDDIFAQYKHARMLIMEYRDNEEAVLSVIKWIAGIGEKKYAPAYYLLGYMYWLGIGVEKSDEMYLDCLKVAYTYYTDGGFVGDIETLKNVADALKFKDKCLWACQLYAMGASQGDASCSYGAGELFYSSTISNQSKYAEFSAIPIAERRQYAVFALEEAGSKGNIRAIELLCQFYELGRCGVSINLNKALDWNKKGLELAKAKLDEVKADAKSQDFDISMAQMSYDFFANNIKDISAKLPSTKPDSTTNVASTTGFKATNNGAKTKKKVPNKWKRMLVGFGIVFFGYGIYGFVEGISNTVDIGLLILGVVLTISGAWILINRIRFGVCDIVEVDDTTNGSSNVTSSSYTTRPTTNNSSTRANYSSGSNSGTPKTEQKAKSYRLVISGASYGEEYTVDNMNEWRSDIKRSGSMTGYELTSSGHLYDRDGKEIGYLIGYKTSFEVGESKSGNVQYYADYKGEQPFQHWEVVEK